MLFLIPHRYIGEPRELLKEKEALENGKSIVKRSIEEPMDYNSFTYLYPPRPTTAVEFGGATFNDLKDIGWVAQLKLNGQRNVIYIGPGKVVEFWNRHREKHRNYSPPSWIIEELLDIFHPKDNEWLVIDSELLHAKDPKVKNTIYVWDILVSGNKLLLDTTYDERYELLRSTIDCTPYHNGITLQLSDHLWLAENYHSDEWDDRWGATKESYVEGFVIKNPEGRLKPMFKEKNNSEWQTRCRKSTASYRF